MNTTTSTSRPDIGAAIRELNAVHAEFRELDRRGTEALQRFHDLRTQLIALIGGITADELSTYSYGVPGVNAGAFQAPQRDPVVQGFGHRSALPDRDPDPSACNEDQPAPTSAASQP